MWCMFANTNNSQCVLNVGQMTTATYDVDPPIWCCGWCLDHEKPSLICNHPIPESDISTQQGNMKAFIPQIQVKWDVVRLIHKRLNRQNLTPGGDLYTLQLITPWDVSELQTGILTICPGWYILIDGIRWSSRKYVSFINLHITICEEHIVTIRFVYIKYNSLCHPVLQIYSKICLCRSNRVMYQSLS